LAVTGNTANKYRAYAEVWGVGANGEVAICWIGGVTSTVALGSGYVLPLGLDLQWVAKAGAKAPFTLKNVLVQDIGTFMPVSQAAQIVVSTTGLAKLHNMVAMLAKLPNVQTEITEQMRSGVRPAHLVNVNVTGSVPLIALHGYCSGRNPFQANSEDFTNALYFVDGKANRLHDAYAMLVNAFAEANGASAWAGVGHSQGGSVLLHLHEYYWTGLSVPTSGRRIQSIGSPYLGCTGAGSAANLIKIFGAGCGSNYDLAVDGATLWSRALTPAAKADVYFYTTTYKQGTFFGDWCNLAVNLVLEWPNDGTAELEYSILPGANNMGNTQEQCHTIDMGYPPQYDDSGRNAIINNNRASMA